MINADSKIAIQNKWKFHADPDCKPRALERKIDMLRQWIYKAYFTARQKSHISVKPRFLGPKRTQTKFNMALLCQQQGLLHFKWIKNRSVLF